MAFKPTRLEARKNPDYKASGIKSYVYALNKYNITPTKPGPYQRASQTTTSPGVKSAGPQQPSTNVDQGQSAKGSSDGPLKKQVDGQPDGEVTTDDQQNDALWLSDVACGTPAQSLRLNFDTGSSDTWLWSTRLPANVQQQGRMSGHNIFDEKKSSTFKNQPGSTWSITYGDGSTASGTVGLDTLLLGGLSIENQAVELATTLSNSFVYGVGDGLMGLGFRVLNRVRPMQVATPVENLVAQKDIRNAVFTAYLGSWRDANEDDKGMSFYTFGFIDAAPLQRAGVTQPFYVPIDPRNGWWQVKSTTASTNGRILMRSQTNTAIIDTGTTLALVDDDLCAQIYSVIPGAFYERAVQGWIFPANLQEKDLPVIMLAVGDRLWPIQKEDLAFAWVGSVNGRTYVYGGIQSRGNLTFDIFGGTFLKSVYAIFDVGRKRFGAVKRVEKFQNLATPT